MSNINIDEARLAAVKAEMERFSKDVNASPEMAKQLQSLGDNYPAMVAMANAKGYNFTLEEVKAVLDASGELSNEELEQVAGGKSKVNIVYVGWVVNF